MNGQAAVAVESSLERDFAMLVQFRKGFVAIEEQPVKIRLLAPGRGYVPDFLVTWTSPRPRDLVEVKYQAELEAKRQYFAPRFAAAERFACDNGWRFIVVTERDIRTPLLANAKFLLPFRRRAIDPGLCARLLVGAATAAPLAASRLLEACFQAHADRIAALPSLWHLVATFRLNADLEVPLTMDTLLTVGEGSHA